MLKNMSELQLILKILNLWTASSQKKTLLHYENVKTLSSKCFFSPLIFAQVYNLRVVLFIYLFFLFFFYIFWGS